MKNTTKIGPVASAHMNLRVILEMYGLPQHPVGAEQLAKCLRKTYPVWIDVAHLSVK